MIPSYRSIAPAKINLGLRVVGRRDDGFHDLESVFLPLEFSDRLHLEPSEHDRFTCTRKDLETPDNLVLRARDLFREYLQHRLDAGKPDEQQTALLKRFLAMKCHLKLEKMIPAGAGLGGGSSDAASCLKLMQSFAQDHGIQAISTESLLPLALQLGSDVPFFMKSEAAYVTGRGEHIVTFIPRLKRSILLVWPGFSIPTSWAFSRLSQFLIKTGDYSKLLGFSEFEGCLQKLENVPENDFEQVVFQEYPELERIKQDLLDLGATHAAMSGSGSTLFGLFENDVTASQALRFFRVNFPESWLTHILTVR
jgi:4-diphosphocytidyl-2-C-methyl-D-erythritol kinase